VYLHVPQPTVPVQHCARGPPEAECPGQYSGQLRSIANHFAGLSVSFALPLERLLQPAKKITGETKAFVAEKKNCRQAHGANA